MRVVKEAIVNAVIHRDYRLNRDIFVRLFDNRIEIESPGALPGAVTVANIGHVGSKARNPLIARALRDFPVRPNLDAGEGVRMMFDEMAQCRLYPPLYLESEEAAGDLVTVVLMRDSKAPLWDAVSDWIDHHGPIGNAVVCRLGGLKTVKASRMLKLWTDMGLLRVVGSGDRRHRSYHKQAKAQHDSSFSLTDENEESET
jgi:ATP-dependent DNA helicase RecG